MPDDTNIPRQITVFFRGLGAAPRSVLAAVSGGADSVALLHLLHRYQEELGIGRLAVAHVNHGLRGRESDGDERFVSDLAGRLRLEFFVTRLSANDNYINNNYNYDYSISHNNHGGGNHENNNGDGKAAGGAAGIEDWARRERYDFFRRTMEENRIDYVATAHTANDQAETVLMRLVRGAGLRGLRGILPVRGDGVIRPLLGAERRDLEAWLSERGLPYRTDSSNADTKFRRNYVRAEIIPRLMEVNPSAVKNIAACARAAGGAWDAVAGRAGGWVDKYVIGINDSAFHIEKLGLSDDPAVREAVVMLFGEYGIPASKLHVDRVISSANLASGEHLLPGGWRFYPRGDRVCFVKT
jgi:tRNA(Ile)-lysidine synthase